MYNHQHHDSISKFHFQHGLDKCKFDHAVFDTSLNELIVNNKLLTPLYYTHLSLIGQKPYIKKSKKSIANFKLRPNMVIGTLTTLHPSSRAFKSYFKHLHLCFLKYDMSFFPGTPFWPNSNNCHRTAATNKFIHFKINVSGRTQRLRQYCMPHNYCS